MKSSALALLSVVCLIPGGLDAADNQVKTIFLDAKRILIDTSGTKTLKMDALCNNESCLGGEIFLFYYPLYLNSKP